MKNLKEIQEANETILRDLRNKKEFGDIPKFNISFGEGEYIVCRNNGQFCNDEKWSGRDGFATMIFKGNEVEFYFHFRNELIN